MGLVHRCEAGERARHRDARGPGDRDAGTMAIGSCGLGRRAGPVENRGAAAPPSPDIIGSQTPSVSEIATAASSGIAALTQQVEPGLRGHRVIGAYRALRPMIKGRWLRGIGYIELLQR